MNSMEKLASLKTSEQLSLIATGLEKMAEKVTDLQSENQKLAADIALRDLCDQVVDSGQNPWASRADTMDGLRKLAAEGRLDAFKVSLDLMPGTLPKLASGLSSGTEVDEHGVRKPNIKEARARVLDAVLGGVVDE